MLFFKLLISNERFLKCLGIEREYFISQLYLVLLKGIYKKRIISDLLMP